MSNSKRMTLDIPPARPELDELLQKANERVSHMTSEEMQSSMAMQALSYCVFGELMLSVDEAEPSVRARRACGVRHVLTELVAILDGSRYSFSRALPEWEMRLRALTPTDRLAAIIRAKKALEELSVYEEQPQ